MRIKKPCATLLVAFLFIVLAATTSHAAGTTEAFEQKTQASAFELIKNWQLLAVISIMVSVVLVAIGYAVGIGFEMPEMKAWAGAELSQIFANVIILLVFIAFMGFVDLMVYAIVTGSSIPVSCPLGESCLKNVANGYLGGYIDAADSAARDVVKNNVEQGAWAGRRVGGNCISILCLQIGYSQSLTGIQILDMDLNMIVFEYYTNLLSSFEAQLFFINNIAYGAGIIILAVGFVARAFFITRKLGGLLIALAAGMMFFLPAMFVFDWVTLETTINGDKAIDSEQVDCPPECAMGAPVAYYMDGSNSVPIATPNDLYRSFDMDEQDKATSLLKSLSASQVNKSGATIYNCLMVNADKCPMACRELPYRITPTCANTTVQELCAYVPEPCKVKRLATNIDWEEYAKCPASCKVVAPMKSDCSTTCLESRYECRVFERGSKQGSYLFGVPMEYVQNPDWNPVFASFSGLGIYFDSANRAALETAKVMGLPAYAVGTDGKTYYVVRTTDTVTAYAESLFKFLPNPDTGNIARCNKAKACTPSENANLSCAYVVPQNDLCNNLCGECPYECRIDYSADPSKKPTSCSVDNATDRKSVV